MELLSNKHMPSSEKMILIAFFCAMTLLGAAVPFYVDALGDGYVKLLALPALIFLGFWFFLSRTTLLIAIILFRAGADSLIESARFMIGGLQIGMGAQINAFILLIAILLVFEKPQKYPVRLLTPWLVFLLTVLIGVFNAPVPADAFRLFLTYLSNVAIFVGAYYFVKSPEDFKNGLRVVVLSSVIPLLAGIYEVASGNMFQSSNGLRLQGTFSHPNIFAFHLTLVISVLLYMIKGESFQYSKNKKLMLTGYMLLLLVCLVLTQTRSAWIATFVMFFMYALLFERRYLVYLLFVPLLALLIPSIGDRILDVGLNQNQVSTRFDVNSFEWRTTIWKEGLAWMKPDHYLFGYGLDSFANYSPSFFTLSIGENHGAHSVYVQLFFELGIFSLIAYIWIFARTLTHLRPILSSDKLAAFILASIVIEYLLDAFSDNMLGYLCFNWYLWFVLGSACGLVTALSKTQSGLFNGKIAHQSALSQAQVG